MGSYVLKIRHTGGDIETRTFNVPVIKIGREIGDICLFDRKVSTRHATILFDGRDLCYLDLGSTHGSFDRHGQRIHERLALDSGDSVHIGSCEIRVEQLIRTGEINLDAEDGFSEEVEALIQSPTFNGVELREGSYSGAWSSLSAEGSTGHRLQNSAMAANDRGEVQKAIPSASFPGLPQRVYNSWLEKLSAEIEDTWKFLSTVLSQAFYTWAFLLIAAALVRTVTGWIPVLSVFAEVMSTAILIAFGPFAIIALSYLLLQAHFGHAIRATQAWEMALRQPGVVWVTLAISLLVSGLGSFFLLVPGIALGVFAFPILLLEDSRYLDVGRRSVRLFKQEPGAILGFVFIGVVLPVCATLSLLSIAVDLLGMTGSYFASVLGDIVISMVGGAALTFLVAWSCGTYLKIRRTIEGDAAIEEIHTHLQQWLRPPSGEVDPSSRPSLEFSTSRKQVQT